jgi:predicted transposase YbfD/YdcC
MTHDGLAQTIFASFELIPDPRAPNRRYRLDTILFVAIVGTLCGADGFVQIERVARMKKDLIAKFVDLPDGNVPTHDTIARLFEVLKPRDFIGAFIAFVAALTGKGHQEVIALDGKTLRGAVSKKDIDDAVHEDVTHMVSAFSATRSVVLAQLRSAAKRNENEAARELLSLLDVEGAVVTMDAAHCSTQTLDVAASRGADVVIAVKHNQPRLVMHTEKAFAARSKLARRHVEEEDSHGRQERRVYEVLEAEPDELDGRWGKLTSLVRVERERTSLQTWHRSESAHYYLTTLPPSSTQRIAEAVRSHWSIENQLHWCLDVRFDEDRSRVRTGYAAENLSRVRHIALALLGQDKKEKVGIKMKRILAAMDNAYLERILRQAT